MVVAANKKYDFHYLGLDLARGLAILGMVFINFLYAMGDEHASGALISFLFWSIRGRPSAVFVVLAGAGISLLTRRARATADPILLAQQRGTLLKRALFLFVLGLALAPLWPSDILHFYGIYIAALTLVLRAPTRVLISGAVLAQLGFAVYYALFDFQARIDPRTFEYLEFWTLRGTLLRIFFNGYYPFFPWIGSLLAGMWLGRQALHDTAQLRRILAVSLGVAALGFVLAAVIGWLFPAAPTKWLEYLSVSPMPPGPLYVVTSVALAFAVICAAQLLTTSAPITRWLAPVIAAGQMALSLYVGHVLIGMTSLNLLAAVGLGTDLVATLCALAYFAAALWFSRWWRAQQRSDPLAWLMRRITDRQPAP